METGGPGETGRAPLPLQTAGGRSTALEELSDWPEQEQGESAGCGMCLEAENLPES